MSDIRSRQVTAGGVAPTAHDRPAGASGVDVAPTERKAVVRPRSRFGRGMFAALRFRDYRLLWTGNVLTQTGQWMQQVALGWLVLELTDSPAYLGLVGFMRGIPMLMLSLPAGVLADRIDRRRLLVTAQVLAAILATILAVLVVTGLVRPWHVLVMSLLSGSVMSFIFPTRQSLVPGLVPRESLANAVALNSAGQNSTRVFGPSLAGMMIGAIGIASCFFAQAVALVTAALASVRMRIPARTTDKPQTSPRDNLVEGLRYIRGNSTLSALIGLAAIPTILALPYMQLLPVIARDELGTGSAGLGLLMTASGVGALAGSLFYAAIGQMERMGRVLIGAAALFGMVQAAFALTSSFGVLLISMLLVGCTSAVSAVYMSLNNTVLQLTVSDEFRGRVMAVYLMTWGFMPFGTLPMGALAELAGAPIAIATGGILSTVLVLLIGLRLTHLRSL